MPRIVVITALHLIIALVSGYVLGMSILGVGFSDSEATKTTYSFLVYTWQVLNAPAGVYVFQAKSINWAVFGGLQLLTSFLWANVIAIVASHWKANRHNPPLHLTQKRLPPFYRRALRVMPMKSEALQRIASELGRGNIAFRYKGDTILVDLPNNFDVMEISIWKDDEDSIQLLNGYFHTHGRVEAWEYGHPSEKAIRRMLERIFSGEILCVEIRQAGQEPVRTIVESIEQISADADFTVYNKNA
jgi:hypothetical protein